MTVRNKVKCSECGSERVWKDGVRYTRFGEVQRYLCRDCGYRFSEGSKLEHFVFRKLPSFFCFQFGWLAFVEGKEA